MQEFLAILEGRQLIGRRHWIPWGYVQFPFIKGSKILGIGWNLLGSIEWSLNEALGNPVTTTYQ